MKKIIVFIIVLALLLGGGFFIYNKVIKNTGPTELDKPIVSLEDDTVSWETINNAVKYEINVDGILNYLANNSNSYKLKDGQSFSIRAIGDGNEYSDSKWSETVVFKVEDRTYTITWKNGEEILEIDSNVQFGAIPSYDGITPSKEKNEEFSYVFSGWSPQISDVNSDVTYYAEFTKTRNTYSVTWKNQGKIIYIDNNVPYGEMPQFNNSSPYVIKDNTYYLSSGWTPSLETVKGDVSYEAYYNFENEKRTVTFKDWDNSIIAVVKVDYGTNAFAPIIPSRDEYSFYDWDKSLDNIIQDIEVNATYKSLLNVKFLDYNGNVLSYQKVEYGKSADSPEDPVRNNYRFTGWDKDFSTVVNDLLIYATYAKTYSVKFYDYKGELVLEENLINGEDVILPAEAPSPEGYKFVSWDYDSSPITKDIEIYALYEICIYKIEFKYHENSIIQEVKYNHPVDIPVIPEYYFDFDKKICFKHQGWDSDINLAASDAVVNAVYTIEENMPVIVIEQLDVKRGVESQDISIYLYNVKNITGIKLNIQYNVNIKLDYDDYISVASPFDDPNFYSSVLDVVKEDSLTNELKFNWVESKGVNTNKFIKLLTLTFNFDKYIDVNNYVIEFINDSYIIDSNGKKVTPILIYGGINIMEE